jgi:hypothetical protein
MRQKHYRTTQVIALLDAAEPSKMGPTQHRMPRGAALLQSASCKDLLSDAEAFAQLRAFNATLLVQVCFSRRQKPVQEEASAHAKLFVAQTKCVTV